MRVRKQGPTQVGQYGGFLSYTETQDLLRKEHLGKVAWKKVSIVLVIAMLVQGIIHIVSHHL